MSGAGSYSAGIGGGGLSPVQGPSPRLLRVAGQAAFYDPRTRTFPFDATGALVAANYVDVAVALAWSIELASIRSAPSVGRKLRGVVLAGSVQGLVDGRMRAAVQAWVEKKLIKVLSIVANVPGALSPGRLEVIGNYKNLVTGQEKTVNAA